MSLETALTLQSPRPPRPAAPRFGRAGAVARRFAGLPLVSAFLRFLGVGVVGLAVDASLLKHEGRWWMFYAVIGPDKRDQRELHVAFADSLQGPWTPHAANPVRSANDGARPAG